MIFFINSRKFPSITTLLRNIKSKYGGPSILGGQAWWYIPIIPDSGRSLFKTSSGQRVGLFLKDKLKEKELEVWLSDRALA
jgi:hypothetical protein